MIRLGLVLLLIYAIIQGLFLGILFGMLVPLPWPYSVIGGYALGVLASAFIAFKLIKPWETQASTKLIAAVILLALTGTVSIKLQLMSLEIAKLYLSNMAN